MKSRLFNAEEEEFILNNYKGTPHKKLTQMLNEKFDKNHKWEQVKTYCHNRKLINGLSGKFQKGRTPHNHRPTGHEFFSDYDGYWFVKVSENKWELKHRYIYEQHYGEIPKGHNVIFVNQDKNDFRIENLKLVKTKDLLVAKNMGLLSNDKELTETGLLVAQVINKTCERRKQWNN